MPDLRYPQRINRLNAMTTHSTHSTHTTSTDSTTPSGGPIVLRDEGRLFFQPISRLTDRRMFFKTGRIDPRRPCSLAVSASPTDMLARSFDLLVPPFRLIVLFT